MVIHSSRLRYLNSIHFKAQERITTIALEPIAHTITLHYVNDDANDDGNGADDDDMAYLNAIAFYFRLRDLFENIDPNTTVTEL